MSKILIRFVEEQHKASSYISIIKFSEDGYASHIARSIEWQEVPKADTSELHPVLMIPYGVKVEIVGQRKAKTSWFSRLFRCFNNNDHSVIPTNLHT